MFGIFVSVPIACWRKGHAREYLETEMIPPPATCYGFLLSLVGETDRERHRGTRVSVGVITKGDVSAVLRTIWRVKDKKTPLGTGRNVRPDFQQLVSGSALAIWVDRGDETGNSLCLEDRVRAALKDPAEVERFGGLSLGESTHLVDEVLALDTPAPAADTFVLDPHGTMTLPVWVDHVGSSETRFVVGSLRKITVPGSGMLPRIG